MWGKAQKLIDNIFSPRRFAGVKERISTILRHGPRACGKSAEIKFIIKI
ncbi:MAG: hypothetical protein LBR79_06875 [Oscillospiraceae bacterium]|nr:hypothetical protein [Oscillospiraceae bacterium]